jgi:hypothetical protein
LSAKALDAAVLRKLDATFERVRPAAAARTASFNNSHTALLSSKKEIKHAAW